MLELLRVRAQHDHDEAFLAREREFMSAMSQENHKFTLLLILTDDARRALLMADPRTASALLKRACESYTEFVREARQQATVHDKL